MPFLLQKNEAYVTILHHNSAFHPSRIGKSNKYCSTVVSTAGCIHQRRLAGDTVMSYMAGDDPT